MTRSNAADSLAFGIIASGVPEAEILKDYAFLETEDIRSSVRWLAAEEYSRDLEKQDFIVGHEFWSLVPDSAVFYPPGMLR